MQDCLGKLPAHIAGCQRRPHSDLQSAAKTFKGSWWWWRKHYKYKHDFVCFHHCFTSEWSDTVLWDLFRSCQHWVSLGNYHKSDGNMKNMCKDHIMLTYCLTYFDNVIKIRDQENLLDGTADVCGFIACRILYPFLLKGIKQWTVFSPFLWSIIPCKNNERPHC